MSDLHKISEELYLASRRGHEKFKAELRRIVEPLYEERAAIMKAAGIYFDKDIATEGGDAYEVPADPEPLYAATLPEAIEKLMSILGQVSHD